MLLFFAALLPCLVWDQDPAAVTKRGIDRVCKTLEVQKRATEKLPNPGVEYRTNEASASRSPWLDGNGWRIQRSRSKYFFYDVTGDTAALAAAESYAYGADSAIRTDAKGLDALSGIYAFLKGLKGEDMPGMANIGMVDDGSVAAGELMNLMCRHNLLFRIVPGPDPSLNLTVKLNTPEYTKADAMNPNLLSHKVRSNLGDDKRLLRIYGSEVVVGRLTGDGSRARLHLIDYAKRPVEGMRVRVLGSYPRHQVAVSGAPGAKLLDYTVADGATEFSLALLTRYAVIDLYSK